MALQPILEFIVPYVAHFLEFIGIFIISAGALKTFFYYLKSFSNPSKNKMKLQFAEAVALALEFKLASEIIKTVTIRSMNELYILGAIILLRVIMTFVIQWEIKIDTTKKQEKQSKDQQNNSQNNQGQEQTSQS